MSLHGHYLIINDYIYIMRDKIKKVLEKRTFNSFPNDWYNGVIDEILNSVEKHKGYVYFISNGNSYNVKVGKSSNINKRIYSFNTTFSKGIYLHGFIHVENESSKENDLHKLFNDKLIRNEWFKLNSDDFDLLEKNHGYKKINSMWLSSTEIKDGKIFNEQFYIEPEDLTDEQIIVFDMLRELKRNEFYTYSEFKEMLCSKNDSLIDMASRTIANIIKAWSVSMGENVKVHRTNEGRGFIIE